MVSSGAARWSVKSLTEGLRANPCRMFEDIRGMTKRESEEEGRPTSGDTQQTHTEDSAPIGVNVERATSGSPRSKSLPIVRRSTSLNASDLGCCHAWTSKRGVGHQKRKLVVPRDELEPKPEWQSWPISHALGRDLVTWMTNSKWQTSVHRQCWETWMTTLQLPLMARQGN